MSVDIITRARGLSTMPTARDFREILAAGRALRIEVLRRTFADRFWARTCPEPNTGCLLWTGLTSAHGYGRVGIQGRTVQAHRVAWELHFATPFPKDMDACHSCDTPTCVNPLHVWPGTARENMLDALRKGRLTPPVSPYAGRPTCGRGHELTALSGGTRRRCLVCRGAYQRNYVRSAKDVPTHCARGHVFDEANTRHERRGPACRACARDKARVFRARSKR